MTWKVTNLPIVAKSALCLYLITFIGRVNAQSFQFADTHPVNNPDSLEQWLGQHQALSEDRLKNLISLERTYTWNMKSKAGTYFPEIKRYAVIQKNAMAKAAYDYLLAYKYFDEEKESKTALYANQALNEFISLTDKSGQLHAYSLLVLIKSNEFGLKVSSTNKPSLFYLDKMEGLLAETKDGHDFLMVQLTYTRYHYGQNGYNGNALQKTVETAIQRINQNPAYGYARYRFNRLKALSYYLLGQHEKSYNLNKQILAQLRPDQFAELALTKYNLAIECYLLKRTEEGIRLCQESIKLQSKYTPEGYTKLAATYSKYRALLQQKGDYVAAELLSDSIGIINNYILVAKNDKKLLELEARYDAERKQKQILILEIQQKQTTQWLIASVLGLLIVGGLTYKLNSTNQKLKKLTEAREYFISIIAHDLRRPLHMFQGMNELVSYNLKNQRFDAIEKLAKAIDDAGSNIQFMLDNLLTWALSQREVLPYHPQKLDLYPKLEEATAVFRSLYTKYPVSFSINCPDTLQIYADPNAIELILRNLIANAHKAIDTKPGNISLEAEAYETRQVIIRINDTGSGMSPAQLQTVREVLSHPLDSQTHPISSGLGLILISQFVSINRGRITVDSSLGTGTSFALVLPADKPVSSGTVQQKLLRFLRKINVSKVMP